MSSTREVRWRLETLNRIKSPQDRLSYFMMKRQRLICALTYLAICAPSIIRALPAPLTSHYLGARNEGGEHVLLFKLPASISSQVEEQLQLQETRPATGHHQSVDPLEVATREQYLAQEPEATQQSISLTIPLSALTTSPSDQTQPEQRGIQLASTVHANPRQNLQLIDYHAPDKSSELSGRAMLAYLLAGEHGGRHTRQEEPVEHQFGQQSQNQSSLIEQRISQLIRAENPAQQAAISSISGPPPTLSSGSNFDAAEREHPNLWQHSQALEQSFSLAPKEEISTQEKQQQLGQQRQEISSLLAKLASSSPELLIRLKDLLRRAARNQGQGNNRLNYTQTDALSGGTVGSTPALSQEHSIGQSQMYLDSSGTTDGYSLGGESNELLGSFLSNHNLSSHEEIKIPFVVIAMPRFISLKRNHLATVTPRAPSSVPAKLAGFAREGNMSQLIQIPTNYSTNSTGNLIPIVYLNGNGANSAEADDASTSSVQRHTMAPYARQFDGLEAAASPQANQHHTNQFAQQLANQSAFERENQLALAPMGQLANQLVALVSSSVPASPATKLRDLASLQNQPAHSRGRSRDQASSGMSAYLRSHPIYGLQQSSEQDQPRPIGGSGEQPASVFGHHKPERSMSYSSGGSLPSDGELSSSWDPSQAQSLFASGQQSHPKLVLKTLDSGANNSSLLENRLAKLRPLFQLGTKLAPLRRPGEPKVEQQPYRQPDLNSRDRGSPALHLSQQRIKQHEESAANESQKPAKMVVMIV